MGRFVQFLREGRDGIRTKETGCPYGGTKMRALHSVTRCKEKQLKGVKDYIFYNITVLGEVNSELSEMELVIRKGIALLLSPEL